MSRISTPAPEAATGPRAEIFAQIRKGVGQGPNACAIIGALKPAALKVIRQPNPALAPSTLRKQDLETIKLTVSAVAGCGAWLRDLWLASGEARA